MAACAALVLAACMAEPKPAMVAFGQTGDFGYSERDLGDDRIEVTYTGAAIRVSSHQGRNDSRVRADNEQTRDLALWRAAQIADERGMEAMKVENETRDTDFAMTVQYVPAFYPYYGFHRRWHHHHYCCGPSWFYDDDYYTQPVRRAYSQSVTTLTILLLKTRDPNDATQLSAQETLTRLQASRSGAVYY